MDKKISSCVVALLFLAFFSLNAYAGIMPSTTPCRVIGSVYLGGSPAPDGLVVEAVPSDSSMKSTTTTEGNYDLNAIGATDGETVSLYLCGISAGTFDFVSFCKTSETKPWIVQDIDLALQPDGERGCTCDTVCSGGHCVNAGATGVCSTNTYFCDSDGICESAFGETISTCYPDCHSSGGGNSGGGSGGGAILCTYDKGYDWACSAWSDCIGGTQTRTCKETNNCGKTYGKPATEQICEGDANTAIKGSTSENNTSSSTKSLFHINAEIVTEPKTAGEDLIVKISLITFGSSDPVDANLEYTISDSDGKIARQFAKTIQITSQSEILDRITTVGLEEGKYILSIKLTYAGQAAPASAAIDFYVEMAGTPTGFVGDIGATSIIIPVGIIALLAIVAVLIPRIKKRSRYIDIKEKPPVNPIDLQSVEEEPNPIEPVGTPMISLDTESNSYAQTIPSLNRVGFSNIKRGGSHTKSTSNSKKAKLPGKTGKKHKEHKKPEMIHTKR